MRGFLIAAMILAGASASQAQTIAPFDMSPERPEGMQPPPVRPAPQPSAPRPVAPTPTPAAPAPTRPAPPVAQVPATPAVRPATGQAAAPRTDQPAAMRRYVMPFSEFALEGEFEERTWSIYLTPEQAAAAAKFNFSYQNSVVVAPEASRLSILVNNREIGGLPIRSSDKATAITFPIPGGLLQTGSNLITIKADQRHRTDCSIESTYELWTDIDPAATYLSFSGPDVASFASIDAVKAIGVDGKGQTQFEFVVPALQQPGTTRPLMRLAQGLAILGGMPNQRFTYSSDTLPAAGPGKLTVVVGTAAELEPLSIVLPTAAQTGPIAAFTTDPKTQAPMLLVSGPTWQSVQSAIDSIVLPTERNLDVRREAIITQRWHVPDAPMVFSRSQLNFSQLGIKTTEFSGRRFRTTFNVAVPADFYATAYGEARLMLDAAYAESVQPGSRIDIYVNGNIASTVPITSGGGGILRHLPIRVTMRHFRPGINSIAVEAVLQTADDKACAPGTTATKTPRFALFDTSEFDIPNFARIGQRPNLAALAGTGFPFGRSRDPVPVFVERVDDDTLSAMATFLGQLALMAGHPIPMDVVSSAEVGNGDALFVGAISQIPPAILSQLNVATGSQASWRSGDVAKGEEETQATFDEWRSRVSRGRWLGQISSLEEWMRRSFDMSWSTLQFAAGVEKTFSPPNTATLMIAQGSNPDRGGSWTLVTAPTTKELREGVTAVTVQQTWQNVSGHITTYARGSGKVETVPVTSFNFVQTVPWSLTNYRLILANWLSTNVLSYALGLVVLSVVLGLATASFLSNFGRRR
ncbi:cellulose biosynthesis cyclic di-GMP-binding regulatory protein BcsB [Rhizobium sp. BK251]|uniref:cellulose biosynthesis cyclic di-GMP-binding regulatory protein BcsB n=1 Tax=Rhizobium sp. BK251 TaxID=2512125 RepID=UPI00104CC40C|nr:cellulose biosynthesis cyclic di-GMP-binding regulatory protein BcsB [Rhizobium sp. BK251]TCL68158.1 cellulose synthase subunit [Rhizobium sp. BK251]